MSIIIRNALVTSEQGRHREAVVKINNQQQIITGSDDENSTTEIDA